MTSTKQTLLHSGLVNGTTYYVAAFPFNDYGLFNRNAANVAKVVPQAYTLFGYYDDLTDSNPETKIHYIEMNAGFEPMRVVADNTGGWTEGTWSEENCWILRGNRPYMVKNDGTIDYELCHTDYSKKIDGVTASDVSNATYAGNAMATIPLIWVKRYTEDNKQYHLFLRHTAGRRLHSWSVHARTDQSSRTPFYPMFTGSLILNKLRSIAGQGQMTSQTGTNEITFAKNNGALWNTGYFFNRAAALGTGNIVHKIHKQAGCVRIW